MNKLVLASIIGAIFNSAYPPAALARQEVDATAAEAHEPRRLLMPAEAVAIDGADETTMRAPDMPTLPSTSRISSMPPTPPNPPTADIDTIVSATLAEAFAGSPLHMGDRAVRSAPYSATVISERVQILTDGNQIVKRVSQTSYRDSAGRTRTEIADTNGTLRSIKIFDAVAGVSYKINPLARSATKIMIDPNSLKQILAVADKAISTAEAAVKSITAATAAATKAAGASFIEGEKYDRKVIVHRIQANDANGITSSAEDIKVRVFQTGDAESLDLSTGLPHMVINEDGRSFTSGNLSKSSGALMSGPLGISFQDREWSKKSTIKELGFKDFNGVRAEGKLKSYTIPAGEIGNKNAITVSTETWTSPELQITVYSKHSDPRTGDNIYRLTNISRNEQPMTLFTVPDGYSVKTVQMPSLTMKSK